jgi:hypothetical protein
MGNGFSPFLAEEGSERGKAVGPALQMETRQEKRSDALNTAMREGNLE